MNRCFIVDSDSTQKENSISSCISRTPFRECRSFFINHRTTCYQTIAIALIIIGGAGLAWCAVSWQLTPNLLGKNIVLLIAGTTFVCLGIPLLILHSKREKITEKSSTYPRSKAKKFKPYPWPDSPKKLKPYVVKERIRKLEKEPGYPFRDRVLYFKEASKRLNILYKAKKDPQLLQRLLRQRGKIKKESFDLYPWKEKPDAISEKEAIMRMKQHQRNLKYPYTNQPITRSDQAIDMLWTCYRHKFPNA